MRDAYLEATLNVRVGIRGPAQRGGDQPVGPLCAAELVACGEKGGRWEGDRGGGSVGGGDGVGAQEVGGGRGERGRWRWFPNSHIIRKRLHLKHSS